MLSSSPVITLSRNSSGSRNAGGPALGTTARGADRLDVAHRPGELAVDLGVDQLAHPLRRLVVDHRVPDRPAVLQPVQIDRTVGAQRVEVVGSAVVLVDEPRGPVADDEGRVAAGPVGDAGLDVDRDAQIRAERELLAVGRAHDVVEAERAKLVLELAGRVAGHQHRGRRDRRDPRATARRGDRRGGARCRGRSGARSAPSAPPTAGRCAGTRTTNRRTPAGTTGRTGSTRRRCRSRCRRGRRRWRAFGSRLVNGVADRASTAASRWLAAWVRRRADR